MRTKPILDFADDGVRHASEVTCGEGRCRLAGMPLRLVLTLRWYVASLGIVARTGSSGQFANPIGIPRNRNTSKATIPRCQRSGNTALGEVVQSGARAAGFEPR